MDDHTIKELLTDAHTIAVVGLSDRPHRPSFGVARYLQQHGYTIIPVNPLVREVLGAHSYPNLETIDGEIDIVDVFRRSDQVGSVVDEAIKVGAKAIWLQLGVHDAAAVRRAREAGLQVVEDMCIKVEHARLMRR